MVEIFTLVQGTAQPPVRSVADDLYLSKPSDVYFGTTAPGIAYYEKSGANLVVTLLDGQEVVVHDFFVIGENGEYSRLLDGAGGSVEVTGLIAPEPFIAQEEPPMVADDSGTENTPPPSSSDENAAAAPDGAVTDGTAHIAPMFGGIGFDKLLFAAFQIPSIVLIASGNDNDDSPSASATTMSVEDASLVQGVTEGSSENGAQEAASTDESSGTLGDTETKPDVASAHGLGDNLHQLLDDLLHNISVV